MLDLDHLAPETLRPISRREYDQMVEMGLFDEDERIELLHGLLVRMSPIGSRHCEAVRRLNAWLVLGLAGRAEISPQCPFGASDDSEPEPDLVVLPPGDYSQAHPTDALLVIEVSDSSLRKDRLIKANLYAANGVPEYWIVNLVDDVLEVFSEPEQGAYQQSTTHAPGTRVSPSAFGDLDIDVADIIP